jgi:tetratricopeptide (TPR) repeat protein
MVIVAVLTWAQYHHGLEADFTFDDNIAVLHNHDAHANESSMYALWNDDFWGHRVSKPDSHKSWRPLVILSYRWTHALQGIDPWGFHFGNQALHVLVTLLVSWTSLLYFANAEAALLSGVLFGLHAVHVEAVVGIVGRAEIMCALFYIPAFFAYRRISSCRTRCGAMGWWGIFMVLYFAACLCKEVGFTLPVLCGLHEFLHHGITTSKKLRRKKKDTATSYYMRLIWALAPWNVITRIRYRYIVRAAIPLVASVIAYLALRVQMMAPAGIPGMFGFNLPEDLPPGMPTGFGAIHLDHDHMMRRAENPFGLLHGLPRVLSLNYLHFRYAWLLVWPQVLSCEYSFNCIPAVEGWDDPRVLLALALDAVLIMSLVLGYVAWVWNSKRGIIRAMLVGWVIVPFLPSANVFTRIGTLLAERLLYVPSIGYCVLVTEMYVTVTDAVSTFLATADEPEEDESSSDSESDEEEEEEADTPAADTTAPASGDGAETGGAAPPATTSTSKRVSSPSEPVLNRSHYRMFFLCGMLLASAGFGLMWYRTYTRIFDWYNDDALFLSAGEVCPNSAKIMMQVGQMKLRDDDYTKAMEIFEHVYEVDPEFCDLEYGLGMWYLNSGDSGGASRHFRKGLVCPYASTKSYLSLQGMWGILGQGDPNATLALEIASVSVVTQNWDAAAMNFREAAVIQIAGNETDAAISSLMEGLYHAPHRCDLYFWLGRVIDSLNRTDDATGLYWESIKCASQETTGPWWRAAPLWDEYPHVTAIDEISNYSDPEWRPTDPAHPDALNAKGKPQGKPREYNLTEFDRYEKGKGYDHSPLNVASFAAEALVGRYLYNVTKSALEAAVAASGRTAQEAEAAAVAALSDGHTIQEALLAAGVEVEDSAPVSSAPAVREAIGDVMFALLRAKKRYWEDEMERRNATMETLAREEELLRKAKEAGKSVEEIAEEEGEDDEEEDDLDPSEVDYNMRAQIRAMKKLSKNLMRQKIASRVASLEEALEEAKAEGMGTAVSNASHLADPNNQTHPLEGMDLEAMASSQLAMAGRDYVALEKWVDAERVFVRAITEVPADKRPCEIDYWLGRVLIQNYADENKANPLMTKARAQKAQRALLHMYAALSCEASASQAAADLRSLGYNPDASEAPVLGEEGGIQVDANGNMRPVTHGSGDSAVVLGYEDDEEEDADVVDLIDEEDEEDGYVRP